MKIPRFEIMRVITVSFLVFFFSLASFFGIMYGTPSALIFGSFTIILPLEWALLSLGTKTILASLIVPVLITATIILLLGRFLCGWICPVGILLERSHHIYGARTLNNKKTKTPLKNNREKYVILLAILLASLLFNFSLPYLFSPPGVVYRSIMQYALQGIIGADLAILLLIFLLDILSMRFGRTWCNTLCPLGTMISSLSVINLIKPKVDQKKCTKCFECERICPMRIPLIDTNNWVMMACTKCLKCVEGCPVNAIKLGIS